MKQFQTLAKLLNPLSNIEKIAMGHLWAERVSYYWWAGLNDLTHDNKWAGTDITTVTIIFIYIQLLSEPSCPVDGDILILEEVTAMRIEMFHHRIEMISLKCFVLICSDFHLRGQMDPSHRQRCGSTVDGPALSSSSCPWAFNPLWSSALYHGWQWSLTPTS